MDEGIRICIAARMDMFEKYYTVPESEAAGVSGFASQLEALGESCADSADFEAKFAAGGYQTRFTELLTRCTPKPYQMTEEQKAASRETAKEIFREDRSRILKEAAADVVDTATVMAQEELVAQSRQAMIGAGVYDDYTRASNAVDMAKDVGGFFKGLLKKKK